MNFKDIDTAYLDESTQSLVIIDQTKLPASLELMTLTDEHAVYDAIKRLCVRGAPAIGVSAAIGLYVCAYRFEEREKDAFLARLDSCAAYLDSSRPTAVNLHWALERMKVAAHACEGDRENIIARLHDEAIAIRNEDVAMCRAIGEHGLTLVKDGDGILTHCNAGRLATIRYGTALSPIHLGIERGMRFKVFSDETRPLLQGARLSTYELSQAGADVTVICDNMASQVMKNGWVQAIFVGADRIAANGDVCNKIGTSGVAILAKYYGVPFYALAPSSTIDLACKKGSDIPIEQRSPDEVTEMWYENRMAPEGVGVYNPAFDVTEASNVTAIVTERGVIYPPFEVNLKKLFG